MTDKKPRILLSSAGVPEKDALYAAAVRAAGGEPYFSCEPGEAEYFDGLILCGGEDVDPARYGERENGTRAVHVARDEKEFALAALYLSYGKPILGICRGAQVLNVALGGTLWGHLPTAADHETGDGPRFHAARAVKDTLFWDLYDSEFRVNSYHHQGVKAPGTGVMPAVYAADGVCEGYEHETLPIIGVQWHPERILAGEEGTAPGLVLFRYFLCLCREGTGMLRPPRRPNPDVRFSLGMLDSTED